MPPDPLEAPTYPDDMFKVFYDHGKDRSEALCLPVILELSSKCS
jgi:hypothetical protein